VFAEPDVPDQAAALAFRRTARGLQMCLIRNRNSSNWGVPKGMIEPGDTVEGTALNETWEEAGLTGRILGGPIGTYEYEKWDTRLSVAVFLLEVFEEHDTWPEDGLRERNWVSWSEAASLLAKHPVRPLLDQARRRLPADFGQLE
jgi:8-oxo-dGTP pyrophosphatase MutT (NUDIX family)